MAHMWTVCMSLFWPNISVIIPRFNASIFVAIKTKWIKTAIPTATLSETVKREIKIKIRNYQVTFAG